MTTFTTCVRGELEAAVRTAYPDIDLSGISFDLTEGRNRAACSGAIKVAHALGGDVMTVANKIKEVFDSRLSTRAELVVSAPRGLLAVAFKVEALVAELRRMHPDSHLGTVLPRRQRVIVDLSAPNVAKELHVGHLRSTIIGDVLARIQEFLGHDVLRLNHIGDWGTQFGMLISHLRDTAVDVSKLDLPMLMTNYQASRKRFDSDEAFKTRSRAAVAELQGGGEDAIRIWKQICQVSREAFQRIYDDLDVSLLERGESFYNPLLKPLVDDLLGRGIAGIHEGAVCVFTEGYEAPYILRKSDGGYSYDTTDLAALKQRIEEEKATRLIYAVDSGQSQHFKQLIAVAIKAGILDTSKVEVIHCGFGVVQGSDGKKFKTRSGAVALLRHLVEDAIARAAASLKEHGIEDPEAAKKLGIGALKYADLKNPRESPYKFDADQLLAMKGKTGAYLCYNVVRIGAIKRKAQEVGVKTISTTAGAGFGAGAGRIGAAAAGAGSMDSIAAAGAGSGFGGGAGRIGAAAGAGSMDSIAAAGAGSGFGAGSGRIETVVAAGGASVQVAFDFSDVKLDLSSSSERELANELVRFPDVIAKVDATLEPHHLCEFLYRVAEQFSVFYGECPVIEGGKVNLSRLLLCDMTDKVLRKGLNLLGITPLEKM